MAVLRRVLVSEPMSAESYYLLGMIHLRRGDKEQAVSSLKTALFWDNRLINAEIALALGYTDATTFIHAFRRWSGMAPSQWRQAQAIR